MSLLTDEKNINELRDSLIHAQMSYEIWRVMKEKRYRSKYTETLNLYPHFFVTTLRSSFISLVVSLCKIYENGTPKNTIPNLVSQVKKNTRYDEIIFSEIDAMLGKIYAHRFYNVVKKLRNEAYAHLHRELDWDELFKELNFCLNDAGEFVEMSQELMNKITKHISGNNHEFNLTAKLDTICLCEDLMALHMQRSDQA